MTEHAAEYLATSPADRAEATVARAVALLKAYGYFAYLRELAHGEVATAMAARCILLTQSELVKLLAPSWAPERRAATAMLTEADGAIREIEARAREGRA